MKKLLLPLLFVLLCVILSGCQSAPLSEVREHASPVPANAPSPTPAPEPSEPIKEKPAYDKNAAEREGGQVLFSSEEGFYSMDVTLELSAAEAQDIFYTDNGRVGERRRVGASCMVDGYTNVAGGGEYRQGIAE